MIQIKKQIAIPKIVKKDTKNSSTSLATERNTMINVKSSLVAMKSSKIGPSDENSIQINTNVPQVQMNLGAKFNCNIKPSLLGGKSEYNSNQASLNNSKNNSIIISTQENSERDQINDERISTIDSGINSNRVRQHSSRSISDKNSTIVEPLSFRNMKINKKYANDFSQEEYRKMETLFIRENHAAEVIQSMLNDESEFKPSLSNHKINERMRMRMVDWMIEVVNNYKCDENVFFHSVDLMDDYFSLNTNSLEPSELHLIGVACMFTSSKFQDIYPLRLKMVQEKIAHKKLSMEEIKLKESEILKMKDFKIGKPTIWDFVNSFIEEIFITSDNSYHINSERLNEKIKDYDMVTKQCSKIFKNITLEKSNSAIFKTFTPNMINLLRHVCLYLSKMNLHDYQLICNKKPSLVASSTLFVALKICEQINKEEYLTDCFIRRLSILSQRGEQEIIKLAQKILNNAQNFDTIFSGLENLKRVHFNAIIELKHTK